jgi:sensor histidine kinase regulating citrate/malate metabolism
MKRAERVTKNLIDEIKSQQLLTAAENNFLETTLSTFTTIEILKEVVKIYEKHDLAAGKTLKIDPSSKDIEITSDRILLRRILGNMVKNALEAVPANKNYSIILGCKTNGKNRKDIIFWVQNPGFIPRDVQLQIFNRSFSTKGHGRGLGTYSMKLLSSFLNGTVTFETSKEKGTTFMGTYPIKLEDKFS